MKQCSKCGELKALTEFYAEKGCRDGLRPDCKACNLAARKIWYGDNKEREIARVKAWQQANAERVNARQRDYRRANPDRIREGHLNRTFGITLEDFEVMLAAQGGGCAICGRTAPEGTSLHVDHDHETGVVRGLRASPATARSGCSPRTRSTASARTTTSVAVGLRHRTGWS